MRSTTIDAVTSLTKPYDPLAELIWLQTHFMPYVITYVSQADEPWSAYHVSQGESQRHTAVRALDLYLWLKDDAEKRIDAARNTVSGMISGSS
jgi:hypothetical protein